MGKTLKKILCSLLVVIMCLTSAPLRVVLNLYLQAFSFNVNAENNSVSSKLKIDYSDLTPNQYMAKVLLNYNYTGLANNYNERDITTRCKQMRWYTDSSNVSSAQPLYKAFNENQTFINSVIAWKILNFDPSEEYKKLLDMEGYYEAILMSILDVQINDSEFMKAMNSSANKTIMAISKNTLNSLEMFKDIDISKINLKQLNISDFTNEEFEEIYSHLFEQRETKNLYKQAGSYLSDGKMILSTCTTLHDVFSTVGKYAQLSDFSESVKNVLYSIYLKCPSSNTAMKQACKKVFEATSEQLDNVSVAFIESGQAFIENTFSYLIGEVWKWAKDASLKALGSSLLIGMDLGKVVGNAISDFVFSTDAIIEQFFVIECLLNFESVMKSVVIGFENDFKSNESTENADNYIKALEMLFSIYDLDYDYTYAFVQIGKERGAYNTIKSWVSGKDETVESFRSSISAMKLMMNEMKHTLTNLEGYRDYYLEDAPIAYDLFFYVHNSISEAYSKIEPVINIAPIFEVEKSNYFILQYTIETDGTATVVGCHPSSSGKIDIPYDFDGCPVRKIGEKAFSDCAGITKVVFPNTLKHISESAFYNCYNLTDIDLNEGLNYIDLYAFYNTAITNITIPTTVISMFGYYDAAFSSFATVLKPRSSLYGMNALKTVVLKSVPMYALYEITTVENISITNDVKVIEKYAFNGCTNISKIDLPKSITEIGEGSFGYTNISRIIIPEGVTTISDNVFSDCSNLDSVSLPTTLIQIGAAAFRNCKKLCNLNLNNGLKSIGGRAFENTTITEITIPNTIEELSSRIQYEGYVSCFKDSNIIKVSFLDGIKVIPSYSFNSVESIVEVGLPTSVERIADYSFCGCRLLSDVYFLGTDEQWEKINIDIYNDELINANIHFKQHQHSYTLSTIFPTCTENGKRVYTCTCGDTYTETIAKLPHSYNAVTTKATCDTGGYTTYTCTCGDTYVGDKISATGHTFNGSACTECDYDKADDCSCNCHASGIKAFFFKIKLFFQKLFKKNQICEGCGAYHY